MLAKILEAIDSKKTPIEIRGVTASSLIHAVFSVQEERNQPIAVVCADAKMARHVYKELGKPNYLEPREEFKHKVDAHDSDITHSRLKVLNHAADRRSKLFIMPAEAFNQTVPNKEEFTNCLTLKVGETHDLETILAELVNQGYVRELVVEGIGQFSVRGGILDFSGIHGNFRIEFFGDEIEQIREFDITTQRSIEKVNEAKILPIKEETNPTSKFTDYFDNLVVISYESGIPVQTSITQTTDVQDEIELTMEKIRINKAAKKAKQKPKKDKNSQKLQSYSDLQEGDYVVHQSHGIGKFLGVKQMVISGARADYLQIQYHGEDKLYIPVNQLDLVYKYVGKEGDNIRLSRLGGAEWKRVKQRVRKACADIAQQLVELYAKRQMQEGHAFSPDCNLQHEFEDSFEYQETDDQLRSIEEVKRDMETPRPMDRLLCGDVGYGKTEVAMRASFKAVIGGPQVSGTQVAYLVPTTVLASQHYTTFKRRMEPFGVKVEMLSRFRSSSEQKKILERVARGEIDIIIGTHRLLQKDMKFKNLGLLIIDEEQRFGVTHKEKIKELKTNVDVLTLTATPIPRTLHMSLVGIRDMSLLEQPPRDRYPVSTYVMEYDFDVITEAILREVARGGQVYYLHNRVETIYGVANRIREIMPELNIAVAHGQMNETALEKVMMQVSDGEIDVLICTTIIETGLDIPNINTIIIENADRMGLSQLYQLRGRVGRSNRLAHAYLTYNRDQILSEHAEKRLKAITEFTEFGSGFKIALRDLEIRGAGNVVGAQQHGHMDAVGYDLYCKFLSEAIARLKNQNNDEQEEPDDEQTIINVGIDAYIPHEYIPGENYRIEMYKKIANVKNEEEEADIRDELRDRFGKIPEVVLNLIDVSKLKALATTLRISEIRHVSPEFAAGEETFLIKMKAGAGSNFNIKKEVNNSSNITFLLQRIKELQNFGR